jgi:hypothetical protein
MFRVVCLVVSLCLPGVFGNPATAAADVVLTTRPTLSADADDAQSSQRLSRRLNPAACFSGSTEFVASWRGKKFLAPCRFIHETLRHLRAVSDMGGAQLIFPLRTDHVHLAVPAELWNEKYYGVPEDESLSTLLWESRLVAVYHANDALALPDSKGAGAEANNRQPHDSRQVLGYYDGRVVEILPARANALANRYRSVAWFYFLPRRLDELATFYPGQGVVFDISFDYELPIEFASDGEQKCSRHNGQDC